MLYNISPVIASIGRSGSGVLRDSIGTVMPKQIPDIPNINYARPGHVAKTHAYPPEELRENIRLIFTYSDPVEIILSIINIWENDTGPSFFNAHKKHLNASEAKYEELLSKDVLKLEKMFDAFWNIKNYPVLLLKYPDFFQHKDSITNFIGRDFVMAEYTPRESKINKVTNGVEKKKQIEITYKTLIEKINNAPSISLLNG